MGKKFWIDYYKTIKIYFVFIYNFFIIIYDL